MFVFALSFISFIDVTGVIQGGDWSTGINPQFVADVHLQESKLRLRDERHMSGFAVIL
jgi:hypothetical protein